MQPPAVRVHTGAVHLVEAQPGNWLTAQVNSGDVAMRDRVGRFAAASLFGTNARYVDANQDHLLSPEGRLEVYRRTPDVRAAIDGIVRRVATWEWFVEPSLEVDDPEYEDAMTDAHMVRDFLNGPNEDGDTWQELWTKSLTDLLVDDAGVTELVFDRKITDGQVTRGSLLKELVALKGSEVHPLVDEFNRLVGYVQNIYSSGTVGATAPTAQFSPEQIVYMRLFPNTSSPEGVPLIETLVTEVVAVLRAAEHSMLSFDANELPPGLLVLSGVAANAAKQARDDMQRMKGKDHRVRVVAGDGGAVDAKWVELRHTPKDLSMLDVVREIRRTIWRVFGVMPVEMGATEDVPRAVGEVQLEVGSSHLIRPILGILQARVNTSILPFLLGDPERAARIRFRFDLDAKLSPEQRKALMESFSSAVDRGVMSRNEVRAELGYAPRDEGDVLTVSTNMGPVPLTSFVPVVPQPTALSRRAPRLITRAADDLPSEWQSAGKFRGQRTLALVPLFAAVTAYRRAIDPLYDEARADVVAATVAAYEPGTLYGDEAARLVDRIGVALDKLSARWTVATPGFYRDAARNGRNSAVRYARRPVAQGWEDAGVTYHAQAMGYLVAPGGLISDLRARLVGIVASVTRDAADAPDERARKIATELTPTASEATVAQAMVAAFAAEEHRIDNWSGKLVDLANSVFSDGMTEASDAAAPDQEWWVSWEAVGDDRMCATCIFEGAQAFRPVAQLTTMPGGQTECGARCRCVVVYWTKAEVDNGTAVKLNP